MTKNEYSVLLDIYLTSLEAHHDVSHILMGRSTALGKGDGLFGKITQLEKILYDNSTCSDRMSFVNIITDENLSLEEKIKKVL